MLFDIRPRRDPDHPLHRVDLTEYMGDMGRDRHLWVLPRHRGDQLLGRVEYDPPPLVFICTLVPKLTREKKTRAVADAGRENQAVAIAMLYLFRSLGSVIGISLSAAVIQHVLRGQVYHALRDHLDVETILRQVRTSLEYIDTLDPQAQGIIRDCYEQATRWSFVLDLIMVAGAIGLGVLICERPLHR